jgi:hypothetical protein
MYDTTIICTYNTTEVFLETDNISVSEKEFVCNVIYRQEFLNIFEMEHYDEVEINKVIRYIYDKIKDYKEMRECIDKLASDYLTEHDGMFGLFVLFSFEYMYQTHICISEYLETNQISENNMKLLRELVFK